MTSALFSPLAIGGLTLANRIAVSPMCQYSAVDGVVGPWHSQHLGSLALSGAGAVIIEATAVTEEGRITHGCVGLYTDAQERALAMTIAGIARFSPAAIGIQLAHAGRKGSAQSPWQGGKALGPDEQPWTTVSSSALPHLPGWPAAQALDEAGMTRVIDGFAQAARRAQRIGLQLAEVHAAHGYLLHQFLSPFSNRREDSYGGSLENRMRFPLAVARAVRAAWPGDRPLGARISATDWLDGGWVVEEAIVFVRALQALGYDYICVSSGGLGTPSIPIAPGYQVPFAARIRRETGMKVRAVGLIVEPRQAEAIVAGGEADMVAIGRAMLDDPRWGLHAAAALGVEPDYPKPYRLSRPGTWPGFPLAHPAARQAAE